VREFENIRNFLTSLGPDAGHQSVLHLRLVTDIETLKAMAVEPQMQRRWEEQLAAYVKSSFWILRLGNWASQSVQLISKLVTAAVLFFGARAVIDGSLSVGDLVAFNMLCRHVVQPVLRLAQTLQDFHQARLSIAQLGDILNTAPEPAFTPGRAALPSIKGAIAFEQVSFRYRPDSPVVLHDIHMHLPAGSGGGCCRQIDAGQAGAAALHPRNRPGAGGRRRSRHCECELARSRTSYCGSLTGWGRLCGCRRRAPARTQSADRGVVNASIPAGTLTAMA